LPFEKNFNIKKFSGFPDRKSEGCSFPENRLRTLIVKFNCLTPDMIKIDIYKKNVYAESYYRTIFCNQLFLLQTDFLPIHIKSNSYDFLSGSKMLNMSFGFEF